MEALGPKAVLGCAKFQEFFPAEETARLPKAHGENNDGYRRRPRSARVATRKIATARCSKPPDQRER